MRTLLDQPQGQGSLVDIVLIILPDLAEGLDADGEFSAVHGAAGVYLGRCDCTLWRRTALFGRLSLASDYAALIGAFSRSG